MVSSEEDAPDRRPPLSKGLWQGMKLDRMGYRTSERAARWRHEKLFDLTNLEASANAKAVCHV